jgi:hypothetical protein
MKQYIFSLYLTYLLISSASQHQNEHYTKLVTITGSLQHAKSDIQQKIEKASWDERPLWMGSLSSVNAALRLASSLSQQATRLAWQSW